MKKKLSASGLALVITLALTGCETPVTVPPEVNLIAGPRTAHLQVLPVVIRPTGTGTTEVVVRMVNKGQQATQVDAQANFSETLRVAGTTGWRHVFLDPGQTGEVSFLSASKGAALIKVDIK